MISNELEQAETIGWLASQNVYGDTFIGTGCFFTLSAFSIRPEQVDHLVVIDVSPKVAEFWEYIKQTLLKDSNREETIGLIMKEFNLKRGECLQDSSWLSTEEQFLKVKKLFTDNKFAFLLADFTNNNTLEKIGLALKNASRSIDTVYQSNIGSVNLANKRIGGAYYLSLKINDYLVRNAIKSDQQINFLEIYVGDGRRGADSQKRRLVNLSN